MNDEVIKNARLKEENERLKKLLLKQNPGVTLSAEQLEAGTSETTIPVNEYRHITDKYNDLNKRYQDAAQRLKYLERKNVAVMQKNKEMKENVRAWQEYCDRQLGKQKIKAETKVKEDLSKTSGTTKAFDSSLPLAAPRLPDARAPGSSAGQERFVSTRNSPQVQDASSSTPSSSTAGDFHTRRDRIDATAAIENEEAETERVSLPLPETGPPEGASPSSRERNGASPDRRDSDKFNSSQITEDEAAEQNKTATAESEVIGSDDDVPQVVSSRCLKRKRKPSNGFKVYADHPSSGGTPEKPIRIKEEQYSSPPPEIHPLLRTETVDLDELGSTVMVTPHRRLRRNHSIHSNKTGTLQNQRSISAPFSNPPVKAEASAEDMELERANMTAIGTQDIADLQALSEPGNSPRINVLAPLDPNMVANVGDGVPNKRIKREEPSRNEHVFIEETGETRLPFDENSRRPASKLTRAQFNRRLEAGKSNGTLSKKMPQSPNSISSKPNAAYTPLAQSARRKQPATVPRQNFRPAPTPDARPVWTLGPVTRPTRKAPAPPAPTEEQIPLRQKPLSELKIQDFKPNPKYNRGYTYAFSETVRKRGERVCLPGCTDHSCCGSTFRTLAAALPSLTHAQEESLLQDYLGDTYDSTSITQMSQEERDELVLQARTRQLANQSGKHRQAYEGRKTPPGFWRMSFPGTQEREEDREKAAEMERSIVRDRWMDAMRGDGRWIFRDE